ncbi:hypothetical protein NP233_g2545 [Leucocoprinus birnbaumii]|uniref:Uncharacterized protein n=1 Tax=Leucocoprinus birnbaumii TaxID=56174 RepID=A0AAD5VYP9_9AGAR|nr:hypothetical protein NP233_g2545 [Leucocoprinus birnbaumii]
MSSSEHQSNSHASYGHHPGGSQLVPFSIRFTGDQDADLAQFSTSGARPLEPSAISTYADNTEYGTQQTIEYAQNFASYDNTTDAFFNEANNYANQASTSRMPFVPTTYTHGWSSAHPILPSPAHPLAYLRYGAFNHPPQWFHHQDLQSNKSPKIPCPSVQPQPSRHPSSVETYTPTIYSPPPLPTKAPVNNVPRSNDEAYYQAAQPYYGKASDQARLPTFDTPLGSEHILVLGSDSVNGSHINNTSSSSSTSLDVPPVSSYLPQAIALNTAPGEELAVLNPRRKYSLHQLPASFATRSPRPISNLTRGTPSPVSNRQALEIPPSIGLERATRAAGKNSNTGNPRFKPYKKKSERSECIAKKCPIENARLDGSSIMQEPAPRVQVRYETVKSCRGEQTHVRGGDGPKESLNPKKVIVVTSPEGAYHLPRPRQPIPAEHGDFYDCRWDGCDRRVRSTKEHIEAHMSNTHRIPSGDSGG